MDFALAHIKMTVSSSRVETEVGPDAVLTQNATVFMAPERLARGTNGGSADVYAYGMTCYQVSTVVVLSRPQPHTKT